MTAGITALDVQWAMAAVAFAVSGLAIAWVEWRYRRPSDVERYGGLVPQEPPSHVRNISRRPYDWRIDGDR